MINYIVIVIKYIVIILKQMFFNIFLLLIKNTHITPLQTAWRCQCTGGRRCTATAPSPSLTWCLLTRGSMRVQWRDRPPALTCRSKVSHRIEILKISYLRYLKKKVYMKDILFNLYLNLTNKLIDLIFIFHFIMIYHLTIYVIFHFQNLITGERWTRINRKYSKKSKFVHKVLIDLGA